MKQSNKQIFDKICAFAPHFRYELAKKINLRIIPEITFISHIVYIIYALIYIHTFVLLLVINYETKRIIDYNEAILKLNLT